MMLILDNKECSECHAGICLEHRLVSGQIERSEFLGKPNQFVT